MSPKDLKIRFVELKSQDQLDMQTLHRSRDRLVGERRALINLLRAILLERGMVAPQGKRKLEQFLAVLMDEQGGAGMSPLMVLLVRRSRTMGRDRSADRGFRCGVHPGRERTKTPDAL